MSYFRTPDEITVDELHTHCYSLSPGSHSRVIIPTSNTKSVKSVLASYTQGKEVGSSSYVKQSPMNFIRTKALKGYSLLTQRGRDAVVPIIPKAFEKAIHNYPDRLTTDGDILYARGGKVGEIAIADECSLDIFSSHILKINFSVYPWYCFSFMKHPVCKLQQQVDVKGSIQALDNFTKDTLLDCLIPWPNQEFEDLAIRYVSVLTQAIMEKEKEIKRRHATIIKVINEEITQNQSGKIHYYEFPTKDDLITAGRMDAGFWSEELRTKLGFIKSYNRSCWDSIYQAGFQTRRGPNLAVSVIGPGYYYDGPTGSALPLVTPADITDYMTVPKFRYYGNSRRIDTVRHGEVMFAAKGKREVSIGHTFVNLSDIEYVTNFDSFLIDSGNVSHNILLAEILSYYKAIGIFYRLSDASNGGSFVERYFGHLPIPKFPDHKIDELISLYHQPSPQPESFLTLDTFIDWHRSWNSKLGIWELDDGIKNLAQTLMEVQARIIEGKSVHIPF